jgi:hypothetical protein
MPGSNSEIGGRVLVVEYVGFLGRLAHLFDSDRIKIAEKGFARLAHGWIDHPLKQDRVGAEIFRIRGAQRHCGAHNFADRDPPALARQLVAG